MRYLNANGDMDEKNIIKLYDYFYHKEHLFIVTEILKDNLYEFYKHINEKNLEPYFNLSRIQTISKQILIGLEYIHSLKMIHCDLKPENILIKSISKSQVKIIDFGSSCFIHDHLSNYMQSRSYRAPEVILGLSYDYKIDIWSLGCIIAELFTGNVLFQNDSIQSYLAKILGICGPFPEYMFKGKSGNEYFSKEKLLFMEVTDNLENSNPENSEDVNESKEKKKKMHVLVPKRTTIRARLKCDNEDFIDFITKLCEVDQNLRLTATEALMHPFITKVIN
jgi:serine/threonine protein kinase